MAEILIVERRYKPGFKYRLGCKVVKLVGKFAGMEIDFEPMAQPGDRVTGHVNCPHCLKDNLVTVSLFNESICRCQHCSRSFCTMNNSTMIWILLRGEDGRMDQH
jgi:hypothetical protein